MPFKKSSPIRTWSILCINAWIYHTYILTLIKSDFVGRARAVGRQRHWCTSCLYITYVHYVPIPTYYSARNCLGHCPHVLHASHTHVISEQANAHRLLQSTQLGTIDKDNALYLPTKVYNVYIVKYLFLLAQPPLYCDGFSPFYIVIKLHKINLHIKHKFEDCSYRIVSNISRAPSCLSCKRKIG